MAQKAVRFRFFAIALRYCMATSASKLRHARVDLMACCCFLLQPRTTATANTTATPGFRLKSRRRKVARRWLWSRRAQGRAAYDKRDDCYVFIPLSCSRANEVFVCIQCSQRPWSPVHGHVNPACLKQQDFVSFCGFCVFVYVNLESPRASWLDVQSHPDVHRSQLVHKILEHKRQRHELHLPACVTSEGARALP